MDGSRVVRKTELGEEVVELVALFTRRRPGFTVAINPDRTALVALYNATDGPSWVNNRNWLTDEPLGVWYGVDTDAAGRVVRIDLAGQWDNETQEYIPHGLRGELPAELENLTELTTLSFSGNGLTGPIPPELGKLAALTSLQLSHNDLPDQVRRSLTTEHGPKEDISIALKGDISTAVRQRPSCKPFVRQNGAEMADKSVPGAV